MANQTAKGTIQHRRGTSAEWASKNPVLKEGEIGYDKTLDIVKIGDGKTTWKNLPTFVKKKHDLNSYTWDEIADIAYNYNAPTLFNIGDEKTITLSTGEKLTLVILDFWHDKYYDEDNEEDVPAGITFGLKNCLATTYKMNATATNVGGWENSQMRTSVMKTLLSQLPADLQAVIKSVKKHTSAGNKGANIVETEDKLFLLSEVEVDGTTAATYKDEGVQYPYFKRNNAVAYDYNGNPNYVKGLADGESGSNWWWLRSPSVSSTANFRCVNYGGYINDNIADGAYGVSFGFCV